VNIAFYKFKLRHYPLFAYLLEKFAVHSGVSGVQP